MHIPQNVFVGADDFYVFGKSISDVFNQNIERVVDCFLINIIIISLKIDADAVEGKTGSERRPLGDLFWRRRPTSFDAENFHALVIKRIVSEIKHF